MIREFIKRLRERERLRSMDRIWSATGGSSWSLFPPSFYATHTKEEIEQAEREAAAECRRLAEQLK